MVELTIGANAPEFEIQAECAEKLRLSDLRGRPIVVYFYPKDDTPGCTREAIDFSGAIEEFNKIGARIIGISRDSAAKHKRFTEKYGLCFPLVADPDTAIIERYGVWVRKTMLGRSYMGIERASFLIDQSGRIARIWRKVKVDGHVAEVLAAAREIAGARLPR